MQYEKKIKRADFEVCTILIFSCGRVKLVLNFEKKNYRLPSVILLYGRNWAVVMTAGGGTDGSRRIKQSVADSAAGLPGETGRYTRGGGGRRQVA